jgi:hypothetical protein
MQELVLCARICEGSLGSGLTLLVFFSTGAGNVFKAQRLPGNLPWAKGKTKQHGVKENKERISRHTVPSLRMRRLPPKAGADLVIQVTKQSK